MLLSLQAGRARIRSYRCSNRLCFGFAVPIAVFAFVIIFLALEPDTLHAMLCMPIWFAILAVA